MERCAARGLGTVIPQDDGEGTALTITTDEPGSVTLQSYAWFMPPATFEFDMEVRCRSLSLFCFFSLSLLLELFL